MDRPAVHSHRSRRSSPLHPLEPDDVQWHSHQNPLAVLMLLLGLPVQGRKQTKINYEAWHTRSDTETRVDVSTPVPAQNY